MESELQSSLLSDGMTPKGVCALVVTVIMIFLASIFVFLRFMQRRRTSIKCDDWFCLASLLVGYCFLITTALIATVGKGGNHDYQFKNNPEKMTLFIQLFIASDVLAAASIALSKGSILLFYRRIFSIKQSLSIATWVVGFLVFGWFVSTSCGLIFASNPVWAEWNPWIPHTSLDHKPFWLGYGTINLILDIVILCLPQPIVWKLNLSRRRKEQLSVVFVLGAFVCVVSAIRIWAIAVIDMDDYSYSLMPISIWNVVEMAGSIIGACLPMLPSLYREYFGSKKDSMNTSERMTSIYRRQLKGYFSGTKSSSSQGWRPWKDDESMGVESDDRTVPTTSEDMKPHMSIIREV